MDYLLNILSKNVVEFERKMSLLVLENLNQVLNNII
jgi:hypothetical protein